MGFAENLRLELEYQDIQIKELSLRTGISKHTLDKYLFGTKSQPGVENALKIAKALGVSVEYLVTGYSETDSPQSSEYNEILKIYKQLNPSNRKTIFDLLYSLYNRQEQ